MVMNLITIDQENCRQDGLCTEICPIGIIEKPPGGYPGMEANGCQFCISCGHCLHCHQPTCNDLTYSFVCGGQR